VLLLALAHVFSVGIKLETFKS